MVHDYWMLRDDKAFVRARLQGVRDVLDWFERHVNETGLVGPMPWWNYLDWAKNYPNGIPPGGGKGHVVAFSLQFVLALQQASEMERALGRPAEAERCKELAERLITSLRAKAWDEDRGLFADSLESRVFSQQTNALAVLAGAVPPERERSVMETVLTDPSLEQATFYFRFYVDEALQRTGMAARYLERLGPWRDMINNGMTTTAETPEPTRSDSHAWAAHPNYQLLATVLGIRPAEPGFAKVRIAPELGMLKRASGRMPHPRGEVKVSYRLNAGKLSASVELPPGVPAHFSWQGGSVELQGGVTSLECAAGQCRTLNSASSLARTTR